MPVTMDEIVLGFDLRADPSLVWADRGRRPREYLLRDVPQPLAADSSVWPYRPADTLQGARSFSVCGWRYSTSDEARAEAQADQVVIGVTVRLVGLDSETRDAWVHAAWVGTPPEAHWDRLGYDVGDGSCLSGLSNCGYGAERAAWVSAWAGSLSDHHLVAEPAQADLMARAMDGRVPEHAPFSALGLYLIHASASDSPTRGPGRDHAAVELHDTRLLGIRPDAGNLILDLSAYVHRSSGRPAEDPGTGWAQPASLTISGGTVLQRPAGDRLWILDGNISVGPTVLENIVPVPFEAVGPVRVHLQGHEGVLEATGTGVRLTLHGEPKYVEDNG
jgi:hypothetical protein